MPTSMTVAPGLIQCIGLPSRAAHGLPITDVTRGALRNQEHAARLHCAVNRAHRYRDARQLSFKQQNLCHRPYQTSHCLRPIRPSIQFSRQAAVSGRASIIRQPRACRATHGLLSCAKSYVRKYDPFYIFGGSIALITRSSFKVIGQTGSCTRMRESCHWLFRGVDQEKATLSALSDCGPQSAMFATHFSPLPWRFKVLALEHY